MRSVQLSRWDVTNLGIQMTLPVLSDRRFSDDFTAILPCRDRYGNLITLDLESHGNSVYKSGFHGDYNGFPEFRSLYLDFSGHNGQSHFDLRLDDSRTSWYGFTRCGTFPLEVAGDTMRFSSQGHTLTVLVYVNNDTGSRFAVGLGYYLQFVRAGVFCDECPVNAEAWSSWAGFAKQAYDTLWNAPSHRYAPEDAHLPRSTCHARIVRGSWESGYTNVMIDIEQCAGCCGPHGYAPSLTAVPWPPWTGMHGLKLNGISAGLDDYSHQEIAATMGTFWMVISNVAATYSKICGNLLSILRIRLIAQSSLAYPVAKLRGVDRRLRMMLMLS
ncbi:hypothetical protein EDC04DRAFT_344157 [Pisolithus marmoratus]|nr:hypothetical protein EDC04DRAFT_344157 [Pisolithus marmoratus]